MKQKSEQVDEKEETKEKYQKERAGSLEEWEMGDVDEFEDQVANTFKQSYTNNFEEKKR